MSEKSTRPSRTTARSLRRHPKTRTDRQGLLDRPFDRKVLARARSIVSNYQLTLRPDPEVTWLGSAVEMPGVFADGPTPDACVKNVREALAGAVATLLELGESPPEAEQRTEQMNIRVTRSEKERLSRSARRDGFRGVADFVRTVALERASRS